MNLKSKALLAVLIIGLLLFAEKKFQFASQTREESERVEYQEEMQRLEKAQEMNKKEHSNSTTQQSPQQSASGYEMRSDGKLHDLEPCSLCEGTGIERNHNRNSLNPEAGRICPMCDGSGHQSY